MARPLLMALIPLMAGIITATRLPVVADPLLLLLALSLVSLFFARRIHHHAAAAASLMISFYIVGFLSMSLYTVQVSSGNHIDRYIGQGLVTVDGTISEDPQVSPDKTDVIISANRVSSEGRPPASVSGKVLLAVKPPLPLKYGDVIRFHTRLRAPHNFSNPGGFDYERYLRYRGIWVRGFIGSASNIVILREGTGHAVPLAVDVFRLRLKRLIKEHAPTPAAEIIQASILGNQREIPRDVREKFNITGTSHIIAISGFNMGIVALFVIFVTRMIMKSYPPLLLRWDWRRISAVLAAVFVILYTFIAGAGISVVRATLMILIFMGAVLLGKVRQIDNTLALAALIILLVSPYFLFDISFQLSFAAVLALLMIAPRLTRLIPQAKETDVQDRWHPVRKNLRRLLIFLAVTISAVIGTLPIIIFYFNRLSLVVLASNLLVVPILGILAIPLCMMIIIAAPVWETAAVFLIKAATFLVDVSLRLVDYLAALPYAALPVPTPTIPEIVAFYLAVFICLRLSDHREKNKQEGKKRKPTRLLIMMAFLLLFFIGDAVYWYTRHLHAGRLTITAIDVGQGSSTLIRFPGGKTMLVDGGGFYNNTFDIGKYVVAPFLWHERITTIHAMVLTHPHPDHLNGLLYILENFAVQEIWTTETDEESKTYQAFKAVAVKKNIPVRVITRFTPQVDIGGVRIAFLNPQGRNGPAMHWPPSFAQGNDAAIVMRISYGLVHCLLPSDISEDVEEALMKTKTDLNSQILLVPHHGSRKSSSSEFIEKVKPEIAILSVGKDNLFRLPHENTLERYRIRSIPLYRTDSHGAITVETDGKKIDVKTYR